MGDEDISSISRADNNTTPSPSRDSSGGLPPLPGAAERTGFDIWTDGRLRHRSLAHVAIMLLLSVLLVKFMPSGDLWSSSGSQDIFSVVIDAGSTGSRVFVFHFKAVSGDLEDTDSVRLESEYFQSVEPGISHYSSSPHEAANSLKPMLKKSLKLIPTELHGQTLIMLKATAGLRLLSEHKAEAILNKIRQLLISSPFHLPDPSQVMIMSGEEEGLFGWVTVNFLLDVLWDGNDNNTVAAFDLGGGSVQVTFEVPQDQLSIYYVNDIFRVNLIQESFKVFTHSYLGYGLKSTRFTIIKAKDKSDIAGQYDESRSRFIDDSHVEMYSECFSEGLHFDFSHGELNYTVRGSNPNSNVQELIEAKVVEFVRQAGFRGGPTVVHQHLHLFSYFFDVARWAGMVPWNEHQAILTPASYYIASNKYCEKSEWVKKHPFLCIDLIYIYTLLTEGVGLPPDKELTVETRLLGREVSWSLGAALSTLSEDFTYERISKL